MNPDILEQLFFDNRDFEDARPLVDIEGLSSPRVCNLLNQLVARMSPDTCYVEVGTWKGLTLLSAAYGNFGRTCIGCDKFRFYGQFTGLGLLARRALEANIRRYRGRSADIIFHSMPYQRMFARRLVSSPIGVYFYDGDHSYQGTYEGIVLAAPFLDERSVLVVDDWNDPVIRRATRDALEATHLRNLWSRELPGNHDRTMWWNGIGLFALQKGQKAPRLDRKRENRQSMFERLASMVTY